MHPHFSTKIASKIDSLMSYGRLVRWNKTEISSLCGFLILELVKIVSN